MILRQLKQIGRMNWLMTCAVLALVIIGIFFIYSACYANTSPRMQLMYQKQITWAIVGMVCYFGFALTDYRSLRKFAWAGYIMCLILLVLVLIVGEEVNSATRSLKVFGIRVQPSELAKLGVILLLARRLSLPSVNLGSFKSVMSVLIPVAIPTLLIIKEPDLGTALVLLPVTLIMMFGAGVPYRALGVLFGIGLACVATVMSCLFLPMKLGASEATQVKFIKLTGLSLYQQNRIAVFLGVKADPYKAGWNKRQSIIAVGSGGLRGKGFLEGTQNILGFLPPNVAPTDFIFSVIAEEMGFMGSATVLFLFGLVCACGLRAGIVAADKMGRLMCIGIVGLILCHAFINIAMTVGLMPITGLPLPLLSYGGSFTIVVLSALGIVQSVYIHSRQPRVEFEQGGLWRMG
jgi:rod shape determining protein RodA